VQRFGVPRGRVTHILKIHFPAFWESEDDIHLFRRKLKSFKTNRHRGTFIRRFFCCYIGMCFVLKGTWLIFKIHFFKVLLLRYLKAFT
jgi:hypothetical protein